MPPGTNNIFIGEQAYMEDVNVCAMHQWDCGGDRCFNSVVKGSTFCAEHIGVKLCKASGIQYRYGGNSWGYWSGWEDVPPHPVDTFGPRTKRAEFCSDRCRNLWRDTKQSRERQIEVVKLENGERSERYEVISNYCNSGHKVIVDKQTGRVVDHST